LVKMAAIAIADCLRDIPRGDWPHIPVILCVAELGRPGRFDGIDQELLGEIQRELGVTFSSENSLTMPHGRVSIGSALAYAREVLSVGRVPFALIVAVDSLLTWRTLSAFERSDRLLTNKSSNGFIAGEGAAALLVGRPETNNQLFLTGLGFATERATLNAEAPLRADGLLRAISAAVADAGCDANDLDFRITDLSGEQYYFREAALALSRLLRKRRETFDIWHPAECIGEAGAVNGVASVVVALAACRKSYAPGPNILCHAAADTGERTAIILQFGADRE
jgi:3-oxoacyl-[acyl-carrier-protein] synthase-1